MAVPTRPAQDGIIDPVWGQWLHDYAARPIVQLNKGTHHFSTPNEVQDTPIPEAVGPCLVFFSCSVDIVPAANQFVQSQFFVSGVGKAVTTFRGTGPVDGPVFLVQPVPKGASSVVLRQTLGPAGVAADAYYVFLTVVPLPDTTVSVSATAESRPGEETDRVEATPTDEGVDAT